MNRIVPWRLARRKVVFHCNWSICCFFQSETQARFRPRAVFLKHFCFIAPFSLWTHRCHSTSLIKQTQGSIFKEFYLKKDILVMYSHRSPCLWINKRFFCFESIEVTAENPFSTKYDVGNDRIHVEHFHPQYIVLTPLLPLWSVHPLSPQNLPNRVMTSTLRTTGLEQLSFPTISRQHLASPRHPYGMASMLWLGLTAGAARVGKHFPPAYQFPRLIALHGWRSRYTL